MKTPTASPLEMPPVPSPEGEPAKVLSFTPKPDSPFGKATAEGQAPPIPPLGNEGPVQTEVPQAESEILATPSLVQRGVDGAKRAAETTKAKLSDAEFRGKLVDASVTVGRVGAAAVKYSRMFEFDPETGAPRVKPKAAESARKHPKATAAKSVFHIGRAIAKEHGTYAKRQAERQAKN